MAGAVNCTRLTARLAYRCAVRTAPQRGFSSRGHDRAAQNFSMPALSPTMTEGNIGKWRLQEGDSFSAGDVILEIETDKASMDVEAQDDGKIFKIMQPDGAKGVKVGERIAIMAEEDDDLASLEIPAESKSASQGGKKEEPAQKEQKSTAQGQSEPSQSSSKTQSTNSPETSSAGQGGKIQKQTYPLFPSVQQLLHENGLSNAEADKIPSTGPGGRLLKGDVLAYLGKISKDYPAKSSDRLTKLSHLDLSNIKITKPTPKPDAQKGSTPAEPQLAQETEVAIPISLSAAIATQKRVQDKLGIFLPLSVFIARASELANEELPVSKHKKPTADDLFNSVLGLDQVAKSSRGHFVPQVTGISPAPLVSPPASSRSSDIIDFLAPKKAAPPRPVRLGALGVSAGDNIFSVIAKAGDENRATEYLERMKLALEKEPGRLVL